jgi:hypothetical protein
MFGRLHKGDLCVIRLVGNRSLVFHLKYVLTILCCWIAGLCVSE